MVNRVKSRSILASYQQTIDYLLEQLPTFSRIGAAAYKKDLSNTIALCNALKNPQNKFPSVHIAGTNGKGSVSHLLAAIFQQAGYKTGLYTSPHLLDFRERIRINGKMIKKKFVIDFIGKIKTISDELQPSFFEITVAMAFDYFATEQIDIAIIETGLGGRLDSTNIILPQLSIITNISYDHQNLLGNTLPEIAAEKAGIIKPDVPVVIGESQKDIAFVFAEKAKQNKSEIFWADKEHKIISDEYKQNIRQVAVQNIISGNTKNYVLDLAGHYQQKNLITVLSAIKILQEKWKIKDADIKNAIAHTKSLTGLRGRWEIISRHPLIVFDVAHNEAGLQEVFAQAAMQRYDQLHIVVGFVKDKNINLVLAQFPKTAHYYFCNANIPRALPAEDLKQQALEFGLQGKTFATVKEAFISAKKNATQKDMILVCGSFFIVSEAM